jgi:hypothetical protein
MEQQPLGYARIWVAAKRDAGWDKVRQGAWYPVLRTSPDRVVLDVSGHSLALPHDALEIRDRQPLRFTVVYRLREERSPVKGTSRDVGRVYAVCPMCATRLKLPPVPPITGACSRCGHEEAIAWWETG